MTEVTARRWLGGLRPSHAPVPPAAPTERRPSGLRLSLRPTATAGFLAAAVCLAGIAATRAPFWMAAAGGIVALVAGAAGNWVLCAGALVPARDPRVGLKFVLALVGDLAILLVAGLAGAGLVFAARAKFADAAVFGVAFAGTALVFRLAGSILVARSIERRGASGGGRGA
jgi:hypothetical protein